MPTQQTFVTQLLRIYHGNESIIAEQFDPPSLDQVKYLCDVGLGPIAFHTYGDMYRETDLNIYSMLQSAELTIRVLYKQMENATVELLASLQSVGVTPVLLKGISTANEFYSPSHLRLMGDIDILVKNAEAEITMAKVSDLGYETADEDWLKYRKTGHHHLPAAQNPKSGVTVEVHTGLFVRGEPFSREPVFDLENIEAQKVHFDYKGSRASRFTPEFQLLYTIAHWAADGNWAINITGINDVIHILRKHESALDWSMLAGWIADNPWLFANIAALLTYLEQSEIVAITPSMRDALVSAENQLQPCTQKLLMWLLHDYPFNASDKSRDGYAIWRAHEMWRELTRPNSRDVRIPYALLRTALRSSHHGKYNPFGWLLSTYRYLTSQARRN